MKVVVVGKGGREHALAWALGRTAAGETEIEVVVTPGGPGIPNSVSTPPEELEADLFVIGPEQYLADGLADRLRAQGKLVFGPGADGAQLEASKILMKEVLDAAGVPTAPWELFDSLEPAAKYLRGMNAPYVIKTDGLAAGKGVLVTSDLDEAIADSKAKLSGEAFGDAGKRIIIEQGLQGREVSFFAVCSGDSWALLPSARDYKRLLDGDQGPNTGGMGAFSPVLDAPTVDVIGPIVDATLAELRRRGIDYRGVLYGGLMLTDEGPQVLEYNIRLGDPETQVVLPTIQGDLTKMFWRAAAGEMPGYCPSLGACVTVVLASEGYPEQPRIGDVILGIEEASAMDDVMVFHAGTALDGEGRFVTAGGRVLSVTARGNSVAQARERAYLAVDRIHFRGMQFRTDIAAGE